MFYILLVYIYDVQLTSVGLAQARPNDAYMKELNAVVLYAVIFVARSIFVSLSPSYSSTCQAYCKKLMHHEKA